MLAVAAAIVIHAAIGALLTFSPTGGVSSLPPDDQQAVAVELVSFDRTAPHAVDGSSGNEQPRYTGLKPAPAPPPTASGREAARGWSTQSDRDVPASPAAGLPTAPRAMAQPGEDASLFEQTLLVHIEQFRNYPSRARDGGIQGIVLLHFSMDRQGHLVDAWVERSSGSTSLDAEALAAIQRAQPLPQIPPNLPDRLSVAIPISFTLR